MKGTPRHDLLPLSQVFDRHIRRTDPATVPLLGDRFRAVLHTRDHFVSAHFLVSASDAEFDIALAAFYEAVVPAPLHLAAIKRRSGFVRFALNHLLHCPDSLAMRL